MTHDISWLNETNAGVSSKGRKNSTTARTIDMIDDSIADKIGEHDNSYGRRVQSASVLSALQLQRHADPFSQKVRSIPCTS